MRRFWPRSLLGQMLVWVALALLVAQGISAALLYQAAEQRRETQLLESAAFRIASGIRGEARREAQDRPFRRGGRRGMALVTTPVLPFLPGESRDAVREEALIELFDARGFAVDEVAVIEREAARDPAARRFFERRRGLGRELPERIALVGVRLPDESQWRIARVPIAPRMPGNLWGLAIQSALIFALLVAALAFLLRRITRPLAALTDRVERYDGASRPDLAPLEPDGPEDTRRLIAAHNAMEARIDALLAEKDVMLGAIGHDLKTPLAALRVRIESMPDEQVRARMAEGIEEMTAMLDDILSLARVGRPTEAAEATRLDALVEALASEYEDLGQPVKLGETERIVAPVRAMWIRRALRNLIGNAVRYAGGATIALERRGTDAVFTVTDDGPGIPDADLAAMLEPFSRGEASRNRTTGGAGLGLALARAAAQQHGGSLTLANRAEGGLQAALTIPIPARP